MYGDFSKRTFKFEFWTCVYFIQASDPPYLVKIGKSLNPFKRIRDLQVASSSRLQMIWFMRAIWFGEVILQEAFREHRSHGEWYYPHRDLKAFVRRLKAENERTLTPFVLRKTLVAYSGNSDYLSFVDEYEICFRAEHKFIKSGLRKPLGKQEIAPCIEGH